MLWQPCLISNAAETCGKQSSWEQNKVQGVLLWSALKVLPIPHLRSLRLAFIFWPYAFTILSVPYWLYCAHQQTVLEELLISVSMTQSKRKSIACAFHTCEFRRVGCSVVSEQSWSYWEELKKNVLCSANSCQISWLFFSFHMKMFMWVFWILLSLQIAHEDKFYL